MTSWRDKIKSLWKMKRVKGLIDLQFSIGSNERGLWFDADERIYQPQALLGLKFSINFGELMRPVPKFWKVSWAGWPKILNLWPNPWTSYDYWFVFRSYVPLPMPFISLSVRQYGTYLGCKIYDIIEDRHRIRYEYWITEWPTESEGWTKLCPSATLRRTRWK